jgi:pilus assembly protein CpaB
MEWMQWLRNRNVILAAAAVVMGALTFLLAHRYLRNQEAAVQQRVVGQFVSHDVLVAAGDLSAGIALEPRLMARRAMPDRFTPSDAFGADAAGTVLGRRLSRPLQGGEAVTASALEPVASPALSSLVEPGLRALTIPVDEGAAAAGLLSPGDLVDLLLVTRGDEPGPGATAVRPLLQAVRVVATGQLLQRRRDGAAAGEIGAQAQESSYSTVTLHLLPEDAERVVLAQRLGELAVVLRQAGDSAATPLRVIDDTAVIGAPAPRRSSHAAAGIEFIIGGIGAPSHLRSVSTRISRRAQP